MIRWLLDERNGVWLIAVAVATGTTCGCVLGVAVSNLMAKVAGRPRKPAVTWEAID